MARRVAQPPPDAPPVPPERPPKRSRSDTAALREKVAEADTVFNDIPGTYNFFLLRQHLHRVLECGVRLR